jgi:Na+/proline symporter
MIPSPILGILIAAILASAMSTLSSSINSMALTFHIDWGKAENMNSSPSKLPSFFWGFMLFLSSLFPYFLSGQFSEGLVEIGLKVASFTYGPMLAMFFLSPFTKNLKIKLPGHRILVPSLLIGILSTIWISYSLKPAMVYIILIGGILFYIALIILSIFSKHRFR